MRWRALHFVNVSNLVNLTKQLKVADNAEPQVEKESCEERQKSLERLLLINHKQLLFLNEYKKQSHWFLGLYLEDYLWLPLP